MGTYWLPTLDPDETAYFQVDWTDEMDDVSDTINGTPTFDFDDASVYGLTISNIAIVTGSKKVECYIANSDPATNRTNVLANSPYLITHKITTAGGQTLSRTVGLIVAESGSDLTVEDGSGLAAADSYASLADADVYHIDRGNTDWVGTDSSKTRALRRAAQFLDARYRMRWKGVKTSADQGLAWPRNGVEDEDGYAIGSDEFPDAIWRAQCEVARALPYTQKIPSPTSIRRVQAGSVAVEFALHKADREIIDLADELVRPFLRPSNRIVRA